MYLTVHFRAWLIGTFLFLSLPAWAQVFGLPNQERYTITDGLSNNSITDIQQDTFGFLWIATADGLNRFDGLQFQNFHPDPEDSTQIADSFIASLRLDPKGTLVIATQKSGIQSVDHQKNRFRTVLQTGLIEEISNLTIQHGETLTEDADGNLWIGTRSGIVRITQGQNPQKELFLSNRFCKVLYKDKHQLLWAGTDTGLFQWNPAKEKFVLHEGLAIHESGPIRTIFETKNGDLLVGAANGLFLKNDQGWRPIPMAKNGKANPFKYVNAICQDQKNRIWIGGQQGLSILNAETFVPLNADQIVININQLNNENISSLFLDIEDNLWIGTANNGLIRLFLSDEYFPVYRPKNEFSDGGTPDNTIRSIFEDSDGTIWLGSYGAGLYTFDRKKTSFQKFASSSLDPSILEGRQVSAIHRDKSGTLWVGTWGDGLNKLSLNANQAVLSRQPLSDQSTDFLPQMSEIHKIFEDEYDNLWVITNGGMAIRRAGQDQFVEITSYFSLPYVSINTILEDHRGNWWIGTWNGLYVFDKTQVENAKLGRVQIRKLPVASFSMDRNRKDGLSSNRITSIIQDSKKRIWIATYGGGINQWLPNFEKNGGPKGDTFKSFLQKDGLPNNIVFGMQEDNKGRLWLSTNNGLVLFNPETENLQTFTTEDGLQSNQFYFGAYSKTRDGHFIFGGTNGFNIFDPLLFSTTAKAPERVVLTDLSIQGQSAPILEPLHKHVILKEAVMTAEQMKLGPQDNSFLFRFAAPTLNHAAKLRYAYRMKGYNDAWRFTDHENRFALYSNVSEGKYTFEVKASRDGINWSPIREIQVRILPPWYRTWWAYTLLVVFILGILATISWISYRYSNLQNKLQMEQLERQKETEIHDMRMWFFTYISHEFRTPLTLILSPVQDLLRDIKLSADIRNKVQYVHRNSQRLLQLVNQILNLRQIDSGKIELRVQEQDIISFCKRVFYSFSSLADERQIRYHFNSPSGDIPLWFDPDKMEMILYNLISNAFKYSSNGAMIQCIIQVEANQICIQIKDNGPGIPLADQERIFKPFERSLQKPAEGSGIGLALVKELVQLHHGQIVLESKERQGSTFSILLKQGSDHFQSHQIVQENRASDQSRPEGSSGILSAEPADLKPLIESNEDLVFPELTSKQKPTILIAEDNAEIRQYVKQHFESQFQVLEAENGKIALDLSLKHWPDLIISDVMMPELDGISLVKQLKRDPRSNHIPVILLTAKTSTTHKMESFEEGVLEYLTKPVDMTLLKARVIAILRNIEQLKVHLRNEGILPDHSGNSENEKFLLKAAQIVEENFSNPDFNAQDFAQRAGISKSGLYKKLQALTGKSTTQFIRYVRLKHAQSIMKVGQKNISQTAFEVGFNDLKYFRKCFKEEFGLTPSAYLKSLKTSGS